MHNQHLLQKYLREWDRDRARPKSSRVSEWKCNAMKRKKEIEWARCVVPSKTRRWRLDYNLCQTCTHHLHMNTTKPKCYVLFFSFSLFYIGRCFLVFLYFVHILCVCVWYEFTLLVHANFGHVVMFYCCDTHSHTSTLYRYMYHLLFCSLFFLFYFAHRFYWRTKDDGKFSFNTSHIPRKIFAFFFLSVYYLVFIRCVAHNIFSLNEILKKYIPN